MKISPLQQLDRYLLSTLVLVICVSASASTNDCFSLTAVTGHGGEEEGAVVKLYGKPLNGIQAIIELNTTNCGGIIEGQLILSNPGTNAESIRLYRLFDLHSALKQVNGGGVPQFLYRSKNTGTRRIHGVPEMEDILIEAGQSRIIPVKLYLKYVYQMEIGTKYELGFIDTDDKEWITNRVQFRYNGPAIDYFEPDFHPLVEIAIEIGGQRRRSPKK